jgi:hypothetical protein
LATSGRAPDRASIASEFPDGFDLTSALAQLHERDVIRLDELGDIRSAYPFSAVPTAHVVAIDQGPTVFAMCAIDALGIAAMLGRDIEVRSADPETDELVNVSIRHERATWRPEAAVVYVGSTVSHATPADRLAFAGQSDTCVVPAADRCCTVINFFSSPATVCAWVARHPDVSGVVLSQDQALALGTDIFGSLLSTPEENGAA